MQEKKVFKIKDAYRALHKHLALSQKDQGNSDHKIASGVCATTPKKSAFGA